MSLSVVKEFVRGREAWIIADNYRYIEVGGMTGKFTCDSPMNGRYTFDQCWKGNGWSCQSYFAMTFESAEEAQQYLNDNQELIYSVPNAF